MPLERFRITATGHSLNYLPEYIARRHGFFATQGLTVSVSVPSPWGLVLSDLTAGTADATFGGVWVPSMYLRRVRKYTAFTQVANRAPLALVGRSGAVEKEEWRVGDVVGRTMLMKGSNGASVGLFFKMLLRENGIDPKAVNYVQDLDGAMLGELFVGGLGDYLLVDNLSARALVKRHPSLLVVFETVVHGGDVPWSLYYREASKITPEVLDAHERFCVALGQGMDWVLRHDAEDFKDELAEIFPKVPVQVAVDLTNVFRENNMWTSPTVDRKGYGRWQKGIVDGYLVKEPLAYEDIVDNGPATAAQEQQASSFPADAKTL